MHIPGHGVALSDQEGEDLVIRNVRRMSRTPELAVRGIRQALLATRRHGYACERDLDTGIMTVAVAIINRDGRPEGALGLSLRAVANDKEGMDGHIRALSLQARAMEETVWRLPPAHRRWRVS